MAVAADGAELAAKKRLGEIAFLLRLAVFKQRELQARRAAVECEDEGKRLQARVSLKLNVQCQKVIESAKNEKRNDDLDVGAACLFSSLELPGLKR